MNMRAATVQVTPLRINAMFDVPRQKPVDLMVICLRVVGGGSMVNV